MTNILDLPTVTDPALTDVLYIVTDPEGSAEDGQVAVADLGETIRAAGMLFVGRALKQVQNSSSETPLAPSTATGSLTLTANYLTQGKTLRITLAGYIDSTGSPTLTIKFKIGSTVFNTSGAVTAGADFNKVMFRVQVDITIATTGATGTLFTQAIAYFDDVIVPMQEDSWGTIDTTGALVLSVTGQWSAADNGNSLVVSNFVAEALN